MTVSRGDVYYADLNPVVGSEQGGTRPVLVIQNDKGNEHSPTVIVAAITSRKKNHLPTHIPLYSPSMLEKASMVLLEQIRTIDKKRLTEYVGKLGKPQMRKVDQALMISLGIDGERE